MKDIIEKLCAEDGIDQDIKDFMVADSNYDDPRSPNWYLMSDPQIFMLMWQELRDRQEIKKLAKIS